MRRVFYRLPTSALTRRRRPRLLGCGDTPLGRSLRSAAVTRGAESSPPLSRPPRRGPAPPPLLLRGAGPHHGRRRRDARDARLGQVGVIGTMEQPIAPSRGHRPVPLRSARRPSAPSELRSGRHEGRPGGRPSGLHRLPSGARTRGRGPGLLGGDRERGGGCRQRLDLDDGREPRPRHLARRRRRGRRARGPRVVCGQDEPGGGEAEEDERREDHDRRAAAPRRRSRHRLRQGCGDLLLDGLERCHEWQSRACRPPDGGPSARGTADALPRHGARQLTATMWTEDQNRHRRSSPVVYLGSGRARGKGPASDRLSDRLASVNRANRGGHTQAPSPLE
jgi:hypothetical protein